MLAQVDAREGDVRAGTIAVVSIIVACWVALGVVCWIFWRAKKRDERKQALVATEHAPATPEDGKENLEWRSARSS